MGGHIGPPLQVPAAASGFRFPASGFSKKKSPPTLSTWEGLQRGVTPAGDYWIVNVLVVTAPEVPDQDENQDGPAEIVTVT